MPGPEQPSDLSGQGGLAGPRGGSRAAGGVAGAGAPSVEPSTPGAPDAEPSTPAPADDAKVVEATETAARGERRRYRATVAMGEGDDAVQAREIFEAYPDDVRVKSGFVTPLKDDTPAEVHQAFDGVGQAPS